MGYVWMPIMNINAMDDHTTQGFDHGTYIKGLEAHWIDLGWLGTQWDRLEKLLYVLLQMRIYQPNQSKKVTFCRVSKIEHVNIIS